MHKAALCLLFLTGSAEGMDSFYDSKVDYRLFEGRATDRDVSGKVFKVYSENKNVKFFRAGDLAKFTVASRKTRFCVGHIRGVEKQYFTMFVSDLSPCLHKGELMRRGMLLAFQSDDLARRVYDAGLYREILVKRKGKLFKQLNNINRFVEAFEQQRIKSATDFDRKIVEIKKAKQKALGILGEKKKDNLLLRVELIKRMDQVAEDLEFYRVEKNPPLPNRWQEDRDLGIPVVRRPPRLKKLREENPGVDLESF